MQLQNTANKVTTLSELEKRIEAGLKTFVEVGLCLLEIRGRRLYKEQGYSRFEDYCRERWKFTDRRARQLISAAEIGTMVPLLTERQARELVPLVKVNEQEAIETWRELKETHGNNITAEIIRSAVQEKLKPDEFIEDRKPHVSHNSGNNEWYTPLEYIEAARSTMGEIDLDPASSELANQTVQAGRFFTAQEDGLKQEWHGKVWMNPPYSTELIGKFCCKLADHYQAGDVAEAIVLVNNATETTWFNVLIAQAGAVVFPKGRVRYSTPDGELGTPLQGQAFIYLGCNPGKFLQVFGVFGWGAAL